MAAEKALRVGGGSGAREGKRVGSIAAGPGGPEENAGGRCENIDIDRASVLFVVVTRKNPELLQLIRPENRKVSLREERGTCNT